MQHVDLRWLIGELKGLTSDLRPKDGPVDRSLLLAIDQGGHASRAIVFDATGIEVAQAFAPISTFRSGTDRVEHSAPEIAGSIAAAITDVCHALGEDVRHIVGAGVATQRSSIVCWDRRSRTPLSPVLSWQDRRNAGWLRSWDAHAEAVRLITGLPLSPHYGVSKLRWCLDEIPAVQEAAARGQLVMGPLASWVLQQLVPDRPAVVDAANASRTLLWDIRTGDWSPRLMTLAGLSPEQLPQPVGTDHGFGTAHLAGTAAPHAVPLKICTGDQSAVPYAHGAPDGRTLYLNIGTGAFLQCPVATLPTRATPLLKGVLQWNRQGLHACLEGTVNGAGSAIDWLDDTMGTGHHDVARSLPRVGSGTGAVPVFVNGVSGVGSPYWLPHVESRFLEGPSADRSTNVAAVLDSIAFLIAANVQEMRAVVPGLERIVAGGGLSSSDYLCGAVADLCGMTVERSSLREATATGLAFLVAGSPATWRPAAEFTRFTPQAAPALVERQARWSIAMQRAADSGARSRSG